MRSMKTLSTAVLLFSFLSFCGGCDDGDTDTGGASAVADSGQAGSDAADVRADSAQDDPDAASSPDAALPDAAPEQDAAPVDIATLTDETNFADQAPDTFRATFLTSNGTFAVEVTRAWAPLGADRFYNLVRHGYYNGNRFFRVIEDFVAQFGISGISEIGQYWRGRRIDDDPVVESNVRGTLTFATSGPDTRTTQLFVNYGDNSRLDEMGFAPFGRVVEGMDVVDGLFKDFDPESIDQRLIYFQGNVYLDEQFPDMDYIIEASID